MSTHAVEDPHGSHWRIRARRMRVLRPLEDEAAETSLFLLRGALSRLPVPAGHPALAAEAREDSAREEIDELRCAAPSLSVGSTGSLLWLVGDLFSAVRALRAHERPAPGRRWVVVLEARGRLRRGALWLVDEAADRVAAEQIAAEVAAEVAADVGRGRLPAPTNAALISVVDRRANHAGVYR